MRKKESTWDIRQQTAFDSTYKWSQAEGDPDILQRRIQIFCRGGSRYFAEGDPDIWGLKLNFEALLKKKNHEFFGLRSIVLF